MAHSEEERAALENAAAQRKVHPGQFEMFMSPRRIRQNYQALEGDRQETYDSRGGEMTKRPETTGGSANIVMNEDERSRQARWHGGKSQIEDYKYVRREGEHSESDDELFERKLDESHMSPSEYREMHGGTADEPPGWDTLGLRRSAPSMVQRWAQGEVSRPPGVGTNTQAEREDEGYAYVERKQEEHAMEQDYGPSLHQRIRDEGVLSPIHLSYDQMGHTYGKNQIVGGHHRLAVAEDIDPDQEIPVQHWKNFHEARTSGRYD